LEVEDIAGRFFIANIRAATKHQTHAQIFDEIGNKVNRGGLYVFTKGDRMELETVEDYTACSSLISKRMNEIKADRKCDKSRARRLAAVEVGRSFNPPLSADEVESMLARALDRFYGEKRNAAIKAHWAQKNEAQSGKGEKVGSFIGLYREWCSINNHVASDQEIAFFCGKAPQTVSWARGELEKSGFVFSKNGSGFNVAMPEKPKYTESEWKSQQAKINQIEKLLAELKK
jgi:hypothetical protein